MYAMTPACAGARRTRSSFAKERYPSRRLHRLVVGAFLAAICCCQTPALAQEETSQDVYQKLEELWELPEPTEEQIAEMDALMKKYEALLMKEQEEEKRLREANEAIKEAQQQPEQVEPAPEEKPARPTRTSRRPTPTPAPEAADSEEAPDDAAKATPAPRQPTRRQPAQRSANQRTTGRPSRGAQPTTDVGVTPTTEFNEYAENILKDFRNRSYSFSIKDGTYVDLIESFSRMSGLGIIGDAPDGTVTFVSSEEMDFKSALARIQILLFKHPGQYWILLQEMQDSKYLEITRITDIYRVMPLDRIYPTLAEYLAANLDENELALLLYTPESGTIADLEVLRDFMPDYVRIAQHGTQNALTIFGLVKDINKYLELIEKFKITIADPRKLEYVPVEHILPTEALELLKQLMEGFDAVAGAPARSRRAGQPSVAEAQAEAITAVPFDDHGMILVKAMPPKIEEIRRLLPYVDMPLPGGGDPVIVEVKFGTAAEVLDLVRRVMGAGDDAGTAAARRTSSTARRSARARAAQPQQPTSVAIDSLTMIDWPPTNSIILIGPEADVEHAKTLIARFDVPSGADVVVVTLKHRDANEFGPQLTQIMQSMRPTTAATLSITPDPMTQTLTLAGPQPEINEALKVVEKMDVQLGDETPEIHIMVLKHVKPSTLVPILSNWDTGAASGAQSASPRRTRRNTAAAAGKFTADDVTNTMYVVCTTTEWNETYRPAIERLDVPDVAPESTVISLTHLDAQAVIERLNVLFSARAKAGVEAPTFMPVADGLMVVNASDAQIELIRNLVNHIDIDLVEQGFEQKRTFVLEHADPQNVIDTVQSLIGATDAPRKRGDPPAASAAKFVAYQKSVIVWASRGQMNEIAALIEELDVSSPVNEMRSYQFEPGTNVIELADTLRQFFPNSARFGRAAAPPRGRTPAAAKAAEVSGVQQAGVDVAFVPQPQSRRMVVSAPTELFPDIERTIDMLRPDAPGSQEITVEFFAVANGDPSVIAQMVQPIIEMKMEEMIATGEIPQSEESRTPPLNIVADSSASRIVAAAPKALLPVIGKLVADIDAGIVEDIEVRKIDLVKADAQDMVATISAMLQGRSGSVRPAGAANAARPTARRRGRPREEPAAAPAAAPTTVASASTEKVTIVTAPGGNSVVITGHPVELDEIERWIKLLDEETPDDRELKVFQLATVDVEKVADEIMSILDAAGGAGAKAAPEDDWMLASFGGPRVGPEISLTTDPYANTMIVWATPRKMQQVKRWIDLYETETIKVAEELPSILIKLKYADAFDAVYTLEDYIDAIWSKDKPKVDYIPFENTLVIKAKKQEDLDRVRDIVAESIDIPKEGDSEMAIRTVTIPKGVPSDLALKALMMQMGDFDVEVEGLKPDNDDRRLRRLGPAECVLPAAFGQRIAELTAAAAALQSSAQPEDEEEPVDANEMIRRALEGLQEVEAEEAAAEATDDQAAPAERPRIKLRYDPITGSITIEGATRDVSSVRRRIDRLVDDLKPARDLPDIRVYQLQHIDPNIAAQVLESMFNAQQAAAAGRMTPRQLQQQQAQMARQMQQAMQQAQKAGQAAPQAPAEDEKGGRPEGKAEGEEESKTESPSTAIRVFPYPSLRAIIINAQTEMYPVIEELVATIDKKHDPTTDYEFFPLKNLLASEVEQILKIMLGLDQQQPGAAARRAQPARGAQADPAVQAVAELMRAQMNLPMVGDESASLSSAQTITITSNDVTNTVLAVAPGSILDLVRKIIDDLEKQPIPVIEQRRFQLKFADASIVVPILEQLFAAGAQPQRPGGRGGASGPTTTFNPHEVSQYVKFVADVAGNAVFMRGIDTDFEKIQPVIDRMDIETGGRDVITVQIANGNAVEMARTLEAMYGDAAARGAQGAARVKLVGDNTSNIIFVRAPEDVREEIKQRIVDMDQSTTPKLRIIELAHADPNHVATTIEAAFEANRLTGRSRIKVTPDPATQRLMVLSPEELFADIESMARMLDVPSDVDVKIYKLNHAKAPEIFQAMTQLVQQAMQRMGPGSGSGAKIEPFAATAVEHNNSIVVMGGPRTQLMVGGVLEQLDTPSPPSPGGPGASVRVLTLKYAEPESAVRSLREIFTSGGRGGDRDISISSPQGSSAIIVRSTESEYNEIERIVKELDVLPGDTDRNVRMFTLQHTDAAEMQSILENYLAKPGGPAGRGGQQGLVGDIRISAVQGSNALVVTGEEESLNRVADLVARIDVEMEGAASSPAIVQLTSGSAVDIARTLEAMYGEPGARGPRGAQSAARVKLVGDASTNVIFVRAPDDLREEITQRIRDMDESASTRPRTIQLANADPVHVATTIENSFEGARRTGRSRIKVTPDAASQRLMVLCPDELFEDIESMARMLDVRTAGDVHVINLKYAEPDAAVRSLREIFAAGGRRGAQDISISSPQGSNALLIRSNELEYAEIARVVEEIDVLPDDTDRSVRMFTLKHTDATEMQAIVEDYLSKPGGRGGRGGQQDLMGGIRVSPVQSSNALVVTGEEESLNRVADLVERIDVQMEESGSAPKIIKLTKAIPSEIEPTLTQMFVDNQRGGRGGRGPTGGAMVPIIVANDATSSLVVRAGPSDYTLIEKLAQSLDQEEVDPDTGFKLIQVASTYRVEDLAGTIESSIRQAVQPPAQTGRGARPQTQASVQAIPGNNSLLVAGTRKQIEVAEAMVAQIQRTGPQGGRRTILIKPTNMTPEDIQRVIESQIGQDNTPRPAQRGGRGRR